MHDEFNEIELNIFYATMIFHMTFMLTEYLNAMNLNCHFGDIEYSVGEILLLLLTRPQCVYDNEIRIDKTCELI